MARRSERRRRHGTTRARALGLGLAVAASAVLAAGEAPALSVYSVDARELSQRWFRPVRSDLALAGGGANEIRLTGKAGSRRNALASRERRATDVDHILLGGEVEVGQLSLVAVRFGAGGERLGRVRLAHDPTGRIDLGGLDWGRTETFRLRLKLEGASELTFRGLRAHTAAVPEPTGALLLGIGMVVAAARLRRPRR